MRAKLRKAGPKPTNAFRLEKAAKENIVRKRDFLMQLTQKVLHFKLQTPEDLAEWNEFVATVPPSRTQFNGWASFEIPRKFLAGLLPFNANGNDTLKKSGLLKSVEDALSSFKDALRKPDREEIRGKTLAALERQAKLSHSIRLIAEGELLRVKKELDRLNDVCDDLRQRLASAEREGRLASQRHATVSEPVASRGTVLRLKSKRNQSASTDGTKA